VLWGFYTFLIGERRWEIAVSMILPMVLAYTSFRTKRLLIGIYPLFLVGIFYDATRFVQNWGVTAERIHTCDLQAIETALFGIPWGSVRITFSEWFQHHSVFFLDVFCAIPYGFFLYVTIAYALFLYRTDFEALRRFTWSFLVLNLAAFATYHICPAAPPWYLHGYGCVADPAAHASEGPNLARVDAWLGVSYFGSFYGRSHNVFGAVPSLHVSYPLLIILEGWKRHQGFGRGVTVAYFFWMVFSAIYLDHHWILDVVLGCIYTVVTFVVVRRALAPSSPTLTLRSEKA